MTGVYRRSDGQLVEIAKMHPHHAMAALAKLRREEPHRQREISELSAFVTANDLAGVTG